jgi:ABC-type uncharacterized transport system auxiliary subunit
LPRPAPRASALLAGTLEVERLGASDLLRGRALVVASADRPDVLRRSDYHFWVDAPPVLLQDALLDFVREGGLAERAVRAGAQERAAWILTGRVLRFERLAPRQAAVELELSLRRASEPGLVAQGTYAATGTADGDSMEAAVRALGSATAQAFSAFAADVERALAP